MNEYVSIEELTPTVWLLRHHPDGAGYGSPYDFVCVLVREGENGDLATIKGALGNQTTAFSVAIHRALKKALTARGVANVRFERKTNGRQRDVAVRVFG